MPTASIHVAGLSRAATLFTQGVAAAEALLSRRLYVMGAREVAAAVGGDACDGLLRGAASFG